LCFGNWIRSHESFENGRQICEKCGHIVFPEDGAFQCPCLKCVEVRLSPKIRRLR